MENTNRNTFDLQNLEIVININKNGVVETESTKFFNDRLEGIGNFVNAV